MCEMTISHANQSLLILSLDTALCVFLYVHVLRRPLLTSLPHALAMDASEYPHEH